MVQSTERLAELIRGKHQVLVGLRELGLRQAELVAAGETASLLKLLGVKQQLIAALQDLEHGLRPYYAEDPEQRAWPSTEHRAACARQAAECNELLEEIVILESRSAEQMTARRNAVAEQLEQFHAAATVHSAYGAHCRK